ncbi:MAG: oxidoreductase [Candidatus Infernicultor aquiphilus]|uniref:Oxidoreductase n=1 Tax=Candidatus Infernicultor aquiphilus TaxID=1805029 RepID=A0A2M7PMT3_9BACT|nr:MAG: oxidoreductase [Candidatus Atribacteria bacterium CG17_big_fil_post_rev_8_21_14_2_50_34_11]PIY31711.1 MAG: oxidoreductase [Candidatus Atribacteria bacterium CG_4_10_14_3_um_filter_34_13]
MEVKKVIEGKEVDAINEVLGYGMVGGGPGSFIGDVHRKAVNFDGKAKLVAGSFSRSFDNTLSTGEKLGLDTERLYRSFEEMAEKEAAREDKIDFVSIVTPNYAHYKIAKTFLKNGINVVCDKPLCFKVEEAEELAYLAKEKELLFCVTYVYSGFPMVKHAREMIRHGDIGEIKMVMAEYPQEWLANTVENEGNIQAAWRTNPKMAGISNCVGDIGSHIENTVSYITDLKIKSLCAKLDIIGENRTLDTNAGIMIKYDNDASGFYWCSQIAIGHGNDLKIRIYATKGSIEWHQEDPNYLKVVYLDKPEEKLSRGRDEIYPLAANNVRIPGGHAEGYYEAFANIYKNFADALLSKKSDYNFKREDYDYPTVYDGISGVKFINLAVKSSKKGSIWVDF